jgi:hypothetical protein
MATQGRTMADDRHATRVRRTVRRVRNYWYRAGVPRRVRRDKAEELHAHLLEALADGHRIEDVVGDDLAAFASEWAQAERPRPLLDVFLQFVAAVTLVPGGFALLNPWLNTWFGQQDPRTGVPIGLLGVVAVIVPVILGWQVVRVLRHRFTTQQTAALGVLLFVGYTVSYVLVMGAVGDRDAFVVVPPATAWALVTTGVLAQSSASWLKRRR